jgi:hypothetical protein
MQDEANVKERNAKTFGIILLIISGVYAVISCIFQFARGKDGITDGFVTLVLGGVFCAIIGFSFFGKWAVFMRKMQRYETARAMDDEYKKATAPDKKAEKVKIKPKKNDVIAAVAVLIIGLGAAAACWYFAARGFEKLNAPYFIKTDAVLRVIDEKPFYEFYDLNGKFVQAPSTIGWYGVSFEDGYSTTVFYHSLHPEVIRQAPIYVILCGGGIFAAALGVLACMHQLNLNLNYLLPFPAGVIFIGLPVCLETAVALMTGYPFLRLLVGGAGIYACNGMLLLGGYFLYVGVRNIVKKVNGYAV